MAWANKRTCLSRKGRLLEDVRSIYVPADVRMFESRESFPHLHSVESSRPASLTNPPSNNSSQTFEIRNGLFSVWSMISDWEMERAERINVR